MRFIVVLIVTLTVLNVPLDVRSAIRVVDDEVIFTLRAPQAKSVYLVGDFNNWNATVEPLAREGEVFEISLFLVEGSYRYKFIVDGRTILDPSNRGDNPQLGSPLTLIERAGGFVLSTEDVPPEGAARPAIRGASPSFRYIGEFRDAATPFHRAELGIGFDRDRLSGRGLFSSQDDTWGGDFEDIVIEFDRGYVAVDGGTFEFRGFDNDSTWRSSDPLTLVGKEGVFEYDVGNGRQGVALSTSADGTVVGRVLYADNSDRYVGSQSIASENVSSFVAGTNPDTTFYSSANTTADADRFAIEIFVDTGQFRGGYIRRSDRGLHPGLLVDVVRDSSTFDLELRETREANIASFYWLRIPVVAKTALTVGYGTANTNIDPVTYDQFSSSLTSPLVAGTSDVSQGEPVELVDSRRIWVGLDRDVGGVLWGLKWDYREYDFDSRASDKGSADIHRASVWASINFDVESSWQAEGAAGFTDQTYDNAPDEFVFDATAMNPWTSGRDDLTVERIVGLDRASYVTVRGALMWNSRNLRNRWSPTEAELNVSTLFGEASRPDYLSAVLRVERVIASNWVVLADGRVARYDRSSLGIDDTYWSGYIEGGYIGRWFSVNVGYGFDPVVFDATISDYNDIGRTRALRSTLESGIARTNTDGLLSGLVDAERRLEGDNTIKLECIIWF